MFSDTHTTLSQTTNGANNCNSSRCCVSGDLPLVPAPWSTTATDTCAASASCWPSFLRGPRHQAAIQRMEETLRRYLQVSDLWSSVGKSVYRFLNASTVEALTTDVWHMEVSNISFSYSNNSNTIVKQMDFHNSLMNSDQTADAQ